MALQVDDIIISGQTDSLKTKFVSLNWTLNGIYSNSSINYLYIPLQIQIPLLSTLGAGCTKIEAKYVLSYQTDGSAEMDAELYNYTNSQSIAGSQKLFPNAFWQPGESGWIDITAFAGKALRIGNKRVGGTGSNSVRIESAVLILKIS